jgi:hypothetical protein
MAAGKYSFVIEQGATTNFGILYQDSNKEYINLTNYEARMQLRPSTNSSIVYLQLSSSRNSDGTGITVDPSGSINIYISSCTSSMLTFDQAVYDLEIYSGSGACPYVIRLLEGNVKLSKEVTR